MKISTTIFWLITFSKLEGKIQLAVEETIFKFVYVALHLSRCLAILKVLFLLREDQFSIFELSIQPSIKCENVLLEKPSNLLQKWANVVENVVAEINDFFQVFSLLLATFNVFNVEQSKQLEATFLPFIQDMSEWPSKI